MKKFVFLTVGFVPPTDEIMQAWGAWFQEFGDKTIDHIGLGAAVEIDEDGTTELPLGLDSVTGIMTINAPDMDEATALAAKCPSITSIRVYEVMEH